MTSSLYNESNIEVKYGVRWLLIFYHNSVGGVYFSKGSQQLLSCNVAQKFSNLGLISNSLMIGKRFEFLIEYPEFNYYIHWCQSSNPTETSTPQNFVPIHVPDNKYPFEGLALSAESDNTYLDGYSPSNWHYAIGAYKSWPSAGYIAGPLIYNTAGSVLGVTFVKLYIKIRNPNTCKQRTYTSFKRLDHIIILLNYFS